MNGYVKRAENVEVDLKHSVGRREGTGKKKDDGAVAIEGLE